jgi:hypothetical protein
VISTRLTGRAYAAVTHSTCPELTSESTGRGKTGRSRPALVMHKHTADRPSDQPWRDH